jgi:hypothetical protein
MVRARKKKVLSNKAESLTSTGRRHLHQHREMMSIPLARVGARANMSLKKKKKSQKGIIKRGIIWNMGEKIRTRFFGTFEILLYLINEHGMLIWRGCQPIDTSHD